MSKDELKKTRKYTSPHLKLPTDVDHDYSFSLRYIKEAQAVGVEFGTIKFLIYDKHRWFEDCGKMKNGINVAGYKKMGSYFNLSEETVKHAYSELQKDGLVRLVATDGDEKIFRNKAKVWVSTARLANMRCAAEFVEMISYKGRGHTKPAKCLTGEIVIKSNQNDFKSNQNDFKSNQNDFKSNQNDFPPEERPLSEVPIEVPIEVPKENIKEMSLETEFDEFWKRYPRKVSKPKALQSYVRVRSNKKDPVTKEQLLTGLTNYLRQIELQKTDKKFICHPTTWLNQRRWEDDYDIGKQFLKQDSGWKSQTSEARNTTPPNAATPPIKNSPITHGEGSRSVSSLEDDKDIISDGKTSPSAVKMRNTAFIEVKDRLYQGWMASTGMKLPNDEETQEYLQALFDEFGFEDLAWLIYGVGQKMRDPNLRYLSAGIKRVTNPQTLYAYKEEMHQYVKSNLEQWRKERRNQETIKKGGRVTGL